MLPMNHPVRVRGAALALLLVQPLLSAAHAREGDARGELGPAVLERLGPLRARHGLPALAGLVLRDGRVEGVAALGSRCAGRAEAVTVDDPWHLGSCTKAMTATLIGSLVERGALRWEATLGELYP